MRILYAGTPEVAVPTLHRLLESSHTVVGVITRPPARTGRGRKLVPSPVAVAAYEAGVPVLETSTMRTPEVRQWIADLDVCLGVVVAYGALIPPAVLELPKHGWVNLHFSDLPQWRGAAPVQHTIWSGQQRTASCVFQLEEGLDTGPVFSREYTDVAHETAGELLNRLAVSGADQVVRVVDAIADDVAVAVPQGSADGLPYATQLHPAEGFIRFDRSAQEVDCHIRAFTPNPGAWSTLPDGSRIKLGKAESVSAEVLPDRLPEEPGSICVTKKAVYVRSTDGAIRLGQVAPAGKSWMDAAAWGRGARLADGALMGKE